MAQDELTFKLPAPTATCAEAALTAAEAYGDDADKQAQHIVDAWEAVLRNQAKRYVKDAMKWHREGPGEEIAGPIGPVFPLYPYWNLYLGGPWQALGGPGGPFLPNKVIRAGDPTFMGIALWRNPACVNWTCPAPSACELMSGWNAQVWLRTFNFTTGAAGPPFGPFNIAFPNFPNCLNVFYTFVNFPAPPDGQPDLYEVNATVDITGPGAVSFAGYTTWHFDPDVDPFPLRPTVGPHWQFERPARFMVYTP